MNKGRKLELLNHLDLDRHQREIIIKLLGLDGNDSEKEYALNIPVIQHHTSDTTLAINPNEYHVWDEIPSLTISCIAPEDTSIYNKYMFQFTSGTTPTDLTEIEGVHWVKEPDIQPNTIYQVSILHNVGIIYGASINQNVESENEQL